MGSLSQIFCAIICLHLIGAASAKDGEVSVLQISPGDQASADVLLNQTSVTVCSSTYLTLSVGQYFPLLKMKVPHGASLFVMINQYSTIFTTFIIELDNLYISVPEPGIEGQIGPVFPLEWMTFCLSLDPETGNIKMVVNGQLLLNKDYKEDVQRFLNSSKVKVWLLLDKIDEEGENSGKFSNVNIFSSALPLEKMLVMTKPGEEDCGSPGDLLSWGNETFWNLRNATIFEITNPREAPCWKASRLHVFTSSSFTQRSCMRHCQKIRGGRSPPIGTKIDWQNYRDQLEAITEDTGQFGYMWLAATMGDLEKGQLIPLKHWPQDVTPSHEVWRDFYTGEPAEPFLTAESIFYDKEKYLCMQTKKYWKSGKPSNLRVSCDTPDGDSCACQSDQQPPQLRLLGLCAQKSKSDTKGP